ncbi:M20 metallopeptidase family protein [Paenibacillus elgii]|uniref:M20 metallopeptidase family protein n=1 Tax=Paenibacillus elgii TaxID=189691 RepID=UPI0013D71CE0|nr:M20 family metallopeptidase [Paenibacillus elgii]
MNPIHEDGQKLLASAERLADSLVAFRRDLHAEPELSLDERETSRKVDEQLTELGLEVRTGVGGYGVTAELHGSGLTAAGDGGDRAVRDTRGHDAHTAILLGAARLLTERRERLNGSVRFLFQAAEEINAGAKAMIADGALDGVAEIYGLHNLPTLSAGKIATRAGALMGSVDRIEIDIEGKGGHGAIPDQCIDPIVAASAIVLSLQTAVSRELSPFAPAVVTVGSLQAGEANNVIPHRARLTGTVRTFAPEVQSGMPERLERLVMRIAEGHRCRAELRYIPQTPVLVNHDDCLVHVESAMDRLLGREQRVQAEPTMAGEDFSVYLQRVPGCLFWLGSGPETGAEQAFGLHHPRFTLNEACLPVGVAALAAIALERLAAEQAQ